MSTFGGAITAGGNADGNGFGDLNTHHHQDI